MTLITWECLRRVQELAPILGPQNRTQGSCESYLGIYSNERVLVGPSSEIFTNLRLKL